MKQLELKHLAPYLPYGLKIQVARTGTIQKLESLSDGDHLFLFKPILRPLSDLTKEFEYKGKKIQVLNELGFVNSVDVKESLLFVIGKLHIPYSEFTKLCEWHFDIFGLIEKGLAIDINTLDK